tara:strand:+ start:466 stop:1269 length:804 start_codon:yes stop_codon:yes gene_type:complete
MTLQLVNGDCLEKMKDISDNSIDLIICDLPYGCLNMSKDGGCPPEKYGKGRNIGNSAGCSWDIKINLEEFWKQIKRIRKNDHTPCIHFCSTTFGYDLIKSNEKEFRYDIVWCKSNAVGFLSANKKPMSAHEMIYVFSKKGANYNRIDLIGDYPKGGGGRSKSNFINGINKIENIQSTEEGRRCVKSWIEISNKKEKGGHPTAKPVELYKFLISRYSNEGDTVLDPTAGSFNSGLVSHELKRNYIGIEKDKVFFNNGMKKLITPLENK